MRQLSLGTRLAVYVVALLVALQIVALAFAVRDVNERRADRLDDSVVVARNAAAAVHGFVQDVERTSLAMSLSLGGRVDQASAGPVLQRMLGAYPVLRSIFVTDGAGRVIASSSTGVGTDLSSRPYARAIAQGASTVWSGSLTGLETGEITVAYARRLAAASGSPAGALIFAFYPERLLSGLGIALASDAQLILTDQNGLILYDSSRTTVPAPERDLSQLGVVQRALRGEIVPLSDVQLAVGSARRFGAIVSVPDVGWTLAYTRPQAALDAELRDRALASVLISTAMLALAAIFVIALSRRLTRPLAALAGDARAIARGERPAIVPDPSGGVEVEQLASAMTTMRDAVAKREDDLRFLAEASQLLASSLEYEDTLRAVARLAVPRFADWCVVDVVEQLGSRRLEVAHADPNATDVARALATPPPRNSPYAASVLAGRSIVLAELREEDLVAAAQGDPQRLDTYRRMRGRSALLVPLVSRSNVLGSISFISGTRTYAQADVELAEDLGRRAATAIENARLYDEVQRAVRTRDEFLAAAAHELKTPLTTIKGFSQALRRRLGSSSESAVQTLERVDAATEKMTSTIDELLDLARIQLQAPLEIVRARVDLVDLVRDVVRQQQDDAPRHEIELAADEGPLVGTWDRARVGRAVANLLSNAVKYTPAGGAIAVRIRRDADHAIVEVEDSGVGIPSADLPHVFERFRRGSNVVNRVPGTGIGLTLVRETVEGHGGTITVRSSTDAGSLFTMRLPLRPATDTA